MTAHLIHTCHGRADFSDELSATSVSVLLDKRLDQDAVWCRFFSGGRMLRETSFAEFVFQARSLRDRLLGEYGVKRGDRVILKLGNSPELCLAYAALWDLGAIAVPLDPAVPEDLVGMVRADCQAVGKISLGDIHSEPGFFRIRPDKSWFEVQEGKSLASGSAGPDDQALIVYTSGTTGRPKGVLLTQHKLMVNAEAVRRQHGMDGAHTHLCVLPMFHVNALNFSFLGTLYAGSKFILNRNFNLPEFWRIVSAEQPNVISAVPAMLHMLATDRRKLGAWDVPGSLKYFTSAAAPLSSDLAWSFFRRFKVRINQGYGLSEAVNFSLTVPPDLSDEQYREIFLDAEFLPAGCPMWANEMAVLGPDGRELPDGESGEVAIRGPHVMEGYLNRPEETAEALRDGWLMTGDTGFVREFAGRRFFFLQGRVKELILRRGENLSPARLDEGLAHALAGLGVAEFATTGFANRLSGEEVGLVVVGGNIEEQVLLDAGREALGAPHAPKAVVRVERIPRTSTGKVQRTKLAGMFRQYEDEEYA